MSHIPIIKKRHPMLPESLPEIATVCERCEETWPCEVERLKAELEQVKARLEVREVGHIAENRRLRAELAAANERVEAVLKLHWEDKVQHESYCCYCIVPWPCPTIRALDGER